VPEKRKVEVWPLESLSGEVVWERGSIGGAAKLVGSSIPTRYGHAETVGGRERWTCHRLREETVET
jgi:hypothetical protein